MPGDDSATDLAGRGSGLSAGAGHHEPQSHGDGKPRRPRLDRVLLFGGDLEIADLEDITPRGQAAAKQQKGTDADQHDAEYQGNAHVRSGARRRQNGLLRSRIR